MDKDTESVQNRRVEKDPIKLATDCWPCINTAY